MPVRTNAGGGVSAGKDTATEDDVRYPKTFHSGTGAKPRKGKILDCQVKRIRPGSETQKITKGSYIADDIVIDGDVNLASINIRGGTSVFGIPGDPNVVDTSAGNLKASGMLLGQNGFSQGKEVGGEIKTLDNSSFSPSDASAFNDSKIVGSASNQYTGAFDYSVVGYISGRIRIHIANLIAANIRDKVRIGGAGGYIEGTFTRDATAVRADILNGKTAGIKGDMVGGTMADHSDTVKSAAVSLDEKNSRIQMKIPETGKYNTNSVVYTAYSTIRNIIGLTAAKIATGNKILGIDGSYKGQGDAVAENVLSQKRFSTEKLSNVPGTMKDNGAASKTIDPGGTYTIAKGFHNGNGKVVAKTKYVKQLNAMAYRGFGMSSSDYELSEEVSFQMPAAGVVYYNGVSACYSTSRNISCEIYKNGVLVDNRNMTNSDNWSVRGTMINRSFSAAAGDVIKVVAKATSGTHALSMIDATIVYFL